MIDYSHFSKSVIGLVRKANEDSIGSISKEHSNGNGSIHIVCDGMGGHVEAYRITNCNKKYH